MAVSYGMFESIIGNSAVKQSLKRLVSNGRLPQSLLFSGKEGIGKKLFALEIARAFVCIDDSSPATVRRLFSL